MENQESTIFPERVVYGTFWQRFAAALLDGLVLIVPQSFVTSAFGNRNLYVDMFSGHISTQGLLSSIVNSLIIILYFGYMESSKSQASVGKMALGLIVTDLDGNRISFMNAVGRRIATYLSIITILIGYLMMLWTERKQTLHDKVAGTLVVKKQKAI